MGPFAATLLGSRSKFLHLTRALLLPKLRSEFAEFLNEGSLKRLRIFSPPTCVGLRYGCPDHSLEVFPGGMESISWLARRRASPLSSGYGLLDLPGSPPTIAAGDIHHPVGLYFRVTPLVIARSGQGRNINLLSIGYAFRPHLRTRLTLGGFTLPRKPWVCGEEDSHFL